MTAIETALQTLYNSESNKSRLLNDGDYFLNRLAQYYHGEGRTDFQIIEKAIRAGAGNIVEQFLQQKALPSKDETATFITMLQTRAGFTSAEASKIVRLLYQMVGFSRHSASPTKTDKKVPRFQSNFWKGLPKIALVHTLISVFYVLFLLISLIQAGKSNADFVTDPLSMISSMGSTYLMGKLLGPQLFIMSIAAIFSLIGMFIKKPWPYLTAAIIQTLGVFKGLVIELAQPLLLIVVVGMTVIGYISFYYIQKRKV